MYMILSIGRLVRKKPEIRCWANILVRVKREGGRFFFENSRVDGERLRYMLFFFFKLYAGFLRSLFSDCTY